MTNCELKAYIISTPYSRYRSNANIISEIQKYIESETSIDISATTLAEMVYAIKNNIDTKPTCHCGNPVNYHNGKYQKHCSLKCSAGGDSTKTLKQNTVREKYGCDNVFQSEIVKEKSKNTNLRKYGDDNPFKFGSNKFQKMMISKYGTANASRIGGHKSKVRTGIWASAFNRFERFSDIVIPNFKLEEYHGCGYNKIYKWICIKCNNPFEAWYNMGWIPKCPHCSPKSSSFQAEVQNFLLEHGVLYTSNNRSILSGHELDIFIQSKNIAIECNGNYWHSQEGGGKDKKYHLYKTNACAALGVQLLHIFEDEWKLKPALVKGKLLHILKMDASNTIYARNSIIKRVSAKDSNEFLKLNHIQGIDKSRIRLGLYHQEELVAVMTFSNRRFDSKSGYELVRYATHGNYRVIGGAGKLLKYFEVNWKPCSIISYADKRWSIGGLYKTLGFYNVKNSPPSYYYLKTDFLNRINRINFQKHKLQTMLPIFDPMLSEWENMKANGYDRIWDCGNIVFEKTY